MSKVFKKTFWIIFAIFAVVLLAIGFSFVMPSVGIAQAETSIKDRNIIYNSVDKDIVINQEKVLDITETITVTFRQSGINLGLSRNVSRINKITVLYKNKKYVKRTVNKLKLLSVTLDGEKEYSFLEKKGDYFYINTGADGDYKEKGVHVYQIHYLYDMGEDMIKQFDTFTFDIMDYGFRSQVNNFSAKITFPKEFDLSQGDTLTFRTNNMQGLGHEAVNFEREENTISCSFKGLAAEEGLTMQLILPQNYFKTYYYPNSMYWGVLSILIIFFAGVIAIFLFAKLHRRRKMVIVPEFYPPKNMNALEIASAYRGRIKSKDFASLIISWAAQGFIDIEMRDKKKLVLTRKEGVPANGDERKFFLELFDGDQKVKVDKKMRFNIALGSAVEELYEPNKKKAFMNWKFQLPIAFLSFIPFIFYIVWGTTVFGSLVSTCFFLMIFAFVGISVFFYTPIPLWFKVIWCGGFAGAPLGIMSTMMLPVDYDTIGLIYMIIAFMLFANLLGRSLSYRNFTDKELAVRSHIFGFKQFLVTAQLDKLEMLIEDDPNYFYNILPYCYIFGITKKMEEKFKSLHIDYPEWVEGETFLGACGIISHSISSSVGGISSGGSGGGGGGGGGSSGGGGGGGGCGGR